MSYWCYHLFYMSNIATPLTDYRGTCLLTANFFSQKLRKRNLQHQVIFPKKRKLLKKLIKQHFIVIAKQRLVLRQLLLNFLLEIIAPKKNMIIVFLHFNKFYAITAFECIPLSPK